MMKKLFLFILVTTTLFAKETLTIDAKKFVAEDTKNIVIFTGDVKMKKGSDKINAQKLVIDLYLNKQTKQKEPKVYTASGNVYLEMKTKEKHWICKGDKIIYKPIEGKYIVIGNGYAEDKVENRKIIGDKIYIDEITGEANVDGNDKKPIRFIMELETKK
jgi:lipopolysaccharide export system protein LptA